MDDENPRIAILGAGPLGLEAALYARYLGYPTQLFEMGDMCASSVLALGMEPAGEFRNLASRLGVSALEAQDAGWQPPAASASLTAAEWYAKYLAPLTESDLVADALHLQHKVVDITRRQADDESFEIHCRTADGMDTSYVADIVIDIAGISSPNWRGDGSVNAELGFANPEADFYVLGAKSGAESIPTGLAQIRDLFAILGERDDLDLYATMPTFD